MQHRVRLNNKEIELTAKEFALLSFSRFQRRPGLFREQLLEQVWGYNFLAMPALWTCISGTCEKKLRRIKQPQVDYYGLGNRLQV